MTKQETDLTPRARRPWWRDSWLLPALNPFWTAWVPLVYAGLRAKRPVWTAWGFVYLAIFAVSFAEESGVGRPDLAGAFDANLVDLNHASARAIGSLPGVDRRLANRIVLLRGRIGGFSSVYDAGSLLDLPADLVDDLRHHVVCLPI